MVVGVVVDVMVDVVVGVVVRVVGVGWWVSGGGLGDGWWVGLGAGAGVGWEGFEVHRISVSTVGGLSKGEVHEEETGWLRLLSEFFELVGFWSTVRAPRKSPCVCHLHAAL